MSRTDPIVTGTWVAALAAVAAADIAAVQIGREWWRERIRRQTVTSRIEVMGYQLRRQLPPARLEQVPGLA
jgi:hypothetical protein